MVQAFQRRQLLLERRQLLQLLLLIRHLQLLQLLLLLQLLQLEILGVPGILMQHLVMRVEQILCGACTVSASIA